MSIATANPNADQAELAKFSALAHQWWDPQTAARYQSAARGLCRAILRQACRATRV
jgi:2-polyprenyl-3-methyl-5-hydroxy-6-metoxy-1,4-benzoquinol methylase